MTINLRNFDLNLLLIFDALMAERSVTRAAEKVHLSQPAMSQALSRLRNLLDDQILVKTESGLMPTPRAEAMIQPAKEAIIQLQQWLYEPEPFDPETSTKCFILHTVEYFDCVILPRVLKQVGDEAPNTRFEIEFLGEKLPEEELSSGHLDFAIGVEGLWMAQQRLRSTSLIEDTMVILVRDSHPLRAQVSLDQMSEYQYVDYSEQPYQLKFGVSEMKSFIDLWCQHHGVKRSIMITAANYLSAGRFVAETDYMMILPRRIAEILSQSMPLRILETNFDSMPFQINLIWHPRYEDVPAHIWFRKQLLQIAGEL